MSRDLFDVATTGVAEQAHFKDGPNHTTPHGTARRSDVVQQQGMQVLPIPPALATARHIKNVGSAPYPEGIKKPAIDLNQGAKDGKSGYDREFLLELEEIRKEKPDELPAVGDLGLRTEGDPHSLAMSREVPREHTNDPGAAPPPSVEPGRSSTRGMPVPGWPGYYYPGMPDGHYMPLAPSAMHVPHPPAHSHSHSTSNSISITSPPPTPSTATGARLNANSSTFVPGTSRFKVVLRNPDGLEVDINSITKTSVSATTSGSSSPAPRSGFRQGSPSTGTVPPQTGRPTSVRLVRLETEEQRKQRLAEEENEKEKERAKAKVGKRGKKRGDANKAAGGQHAFAHSQTSMAQTTSLEPVAPLQASANRWDRKLLSNVNPESPEIVDQKVKALLNKLTMEKFDSISDQIIAWANKSEKEKDGRTLIQVIRLVFEKATDEATWSEMYARLCRKMMERISPQVQDDGIKNAEGKPITGGQLFRKYLLNRCQEDFERGWVAKEATAAAAATKALEDQAAKAAHDKAKENGGEAIFLYSDEYYAAQKAKRHGPGLIKFIGELFKLQMLTERIMHECVKKLLGNVENPEEEEIESLCKLLTTVGAILDTPKARAHMDAYFSLMKVLTKSLNVTPHMRRMLQDVIELRERKWVSRAVIAAPMTIAQIHEAAAKEKAAAEKESYQRQLMNLQRKLKRPRCNLNFHPYLGPRRRNKICNGELPSMTIFAPPDVAERVVELPAPRDQSTWTIIRLVKGLLKRVDSEDFDCVAEHIIALVNSSDKEDAGRTLSQMVKLLFELATHDAERSHLYARLCWEVTIGINPGIQGTLVTDSFGQAVRGGGVCHRYVVNSCQEIFERGRVAREQGLALFKFVGELFNVRLVPEYVVHAWMKQLLAKEEDPDEDDVESLCVFLATAGAILDTPRARRRMDVYFQRMQELMSNPGCSSPVRRTIEYVIERRQRKWSEA
ncbi:putative middle domain of eukaryotic initiation factor 4G (eIF4G) [Lyophyllum shimeji]|uniref:Middle domain of eukaryotic initiation factor 4G (eIF4G) n=1 Tax=Lyophyllum shimeji TaxID=47721 RepID=A0A9P3PLM1_LYOSH|nr:putative middle domain of eukaryotic initiation factor 4G (eIF4G) [Lyophyllum shimeji]